MPQISTVLVALVVITLAPVVAGAGPTETAGTSGVLASAHTIGSESLRSGPSPDPRPFLPGDGAIPGWMRTEEPRLFNGKTLFAHIDGGAEEFLAQGFRALGVGGYRKDSLEVVAEIYDLGTRKGATAILDARSGAPTEGSTVSKKGTLSSGGTAPVGAAPGAGNVSNFVRSDSTVSIPPAVGEACVLDAMQVIFRRSRFYITVTGFEARPEIAVALRVLADSIDARIRATGRSPAGK